MLDRYEEKLKENINEYEIKTTADDILKAYSTLSVAKKDKKYLSKKSKTTITSILGSLVLGGAVAAVVLVSLNNDVGETSSSLAISNTPIEILNNNETELLAGEIVSLMSNHNSNNSYSLSAVNYLNSDKVLNKSKNNLNSNVNQELFEEAVANFDLAAPSIHALFDTNNNFDIKSYGGEFSINNSKFNVKSEIYLNNSLIYSLYINEISNDLEDDEESWLYKGYIQDQNNAYYEIWLEKEIEVDEYEIESYIFYDDFVACVAKEIENDESGYQFSYFEYYEKNGQKYFNEDKALYSFEFESENSSMFVNSQQISVEVETPRKDYEFFTKIINNNQYNISMEDDEFDNFTFDLTFTESNRIYSASNLNDIIK